MLSSRTSRVLAQRVSGRLVTRRSVVSSTSRVVAPTAVSTKRVSIRAMALALDHLDPSRCFSTKDTAASGTEAPPPEEEVEDPAADEPVLEDDATTTEDDNKEEETFPDQDEPTAEDDTTTKLQEEVDSLKNQLLRSLAEQENTRRIAKRDVSSAKQFAIKSFAKSLLEVSDNLSRAMESVPEELRDDKENHAVLASLYEGIAMTEVGLNKTFESHGVTKYGEVGETFDPNLHDALFEYPDPKAEPGTLGQIMKSGYMLHDRVLRPAEVGVVKKSTEENSGESTPS